jgi:tetratricopeptide (TPR) repeat protein
MEYESGRKPRNIETVADRGAGGRGRKILIASVGSFLLVLILLIAAAVGLSVPQGGFFSGLQRLKNTAAFLVFSETPCFYNLLVEKNGKDYLLTAGEPFEVSWRDQFIVKKAMTDVLSGKGISVDVEGTDGGDDLGRLVKGEGLVDRYVAAGEASLSGKMEGSLSFNVLYQGKTIAAIPIRIVITPQDWLRYARNSENRKARLEYLKKAIAMAPEDLNVRRMIAALYGEAGHAAEAVEQYREILRLKPSDRSALAELTKHYLKTGNYNAVISVGTKALSLNPKDEQALANMGAAWAGLGNWGKAAEFYEKALQLDPENDNLVYKLGESYEKAGKPELAANQYRRILGKGPQSEQTSSALAAIFLKTGNFDGAIQLYGGMLKRHPRDAAIHANLGFAYGGMGNRKEEIAHYRKSVALKPGDPLIHFNLAAALEKEKRYAEAGAEYEKTLKLSPKDHEAVERLADIRFIEKKYREAASLYEKVLRKNPRRALIYSRLGYCYAEMKQPDKALENWKTAIRYGEKDPQVHERVSASSAQGKKAVRKKVGNEKKAARNPADEDLRSQIDLHIKRKEYDKALGMYRKLIRMKPGQASLYSGAAYIYGLKGDSDKQIEYYALSLKYDPEDYDSHLNLAALYEKKELLQEALDEYNAAYRLNPESQTAARAIPRIKIMMIRKKH